MKICSRLAVFRWQTGRKFWTWLACVIKGLLHEIEAIVSLWAMEIALRRQSNGQQMEDVFVHLNCALAWFDCPSHPIVDGPRVSPFALPFLLPSDGNLKRQDENASLLRIATKVARDIPVRHAGYEPSNVSPSVGHHRPPHHYSSLSGRTNGRTSTE
jgi:hypothetical protein